MRRDAFEQADEGYWASLAIHNPLAAGADHAKFERAAALHRYKGACARAEALGFVYVPQSTLVETASLAELVASVVATPDPKPSNEPDVSAILGGEERPPITVSEAFEIYCEEIAVDDQISKSPAQRRAWKKCKARAIGNFIRIVGDKPLQQITREDALKFYNWWAARLRPKDKNKKALNPNTANRDIGNLRSLYTAYFKFIGDEERRNRSEICSSRSEPRRMCLPSKANGCEHAFSSRAPWMV
jgi:hypothetical protein